MNDTQIHILLIEDNPGDARLIEYILADTQGLSFELTWAETLTAGVEQLRTKRADVVLLDLGLPESSGLETLQRLFAQAPKMQPLVVLSGLADESVALQAVQSGAQDYLVKGQADSALLVRSIRYAIERSQAEEALRQAHAELERRVEERTAELAQAVDALHAEIAERERAEEALRERDARIRRLVESNIIGIFFWDIEGGISDANDAFLQMTGHARGDLTARRLQWKHLTPPEYLPLDEHAVGELKRTGTCTPYEKEYLRKDGSRMPILIGGALLEGSLDKGIAFVLDLTARKQADAERQARHIAEEASRAKSEFLANMSHELRSPLNTMLGFARLMARQPALPPEVQEDMQIILRSGEHLHTLINQVLDLSKIEAGRMLLNETSFDLDRLLDELEHMFSIRTRDKGLLLRVARDPTAARHIRTDQVKLRQVLINLLGNAVKFTRKGHVALQVKHRQPPHEGCRLVFAVADTGPGISAEEQQRLFGAFMQASAGMQMPEGSGLGLTISRAFVRLMGGEVRIDSKPGAGTTVSFEIPVQAVNADAVSARESRRQAVALAPDQPRRRILVVDDRREARQLLLRLLTPLGFELREARDGQEAVETWRTWRPHLIWMDMRMPVLDGREAARRIKAEPDGWKTVIIALTASSFEVKRGDIMAAGCDDFLNKPFEEAQLFSLMQKHLGARFIYREDVLPVPNQSPDAVALALLPDALRAALKRALIRLDTVAVSAAIAQIRARDSCLADALQAQTDEFQYEWILRALQDGNAEFEEEEQT